MHPRRLRLAAAVAPTVAALVLSACSSGDAAPSTTARTGVIRTRTTPSPPTSSATSTHPAGPTPAQLRARAAQQLHAVVKAQPPGGVSVAAINMATGREFSAGADGGMRTASAYKLLMVVGILLQDGGLGGDYDLAERALENSDNAAGYSLYLDIGGSGGVQSTMQALGMTHSQCCTTDPTLMKTSARDYLKVVKALVTPGRLPRSGREEVLRLMRNVESDQRWGVGVVADKGTTFANKNGWLSIDNSNGPGDTDDGLWAVTSVGVVTVHGQQLLMAVFTQHQPDFPTGVHLVEKLARLTATMVETP